MEAKLNALIEKEVGEDIGQMLPGGHGGRGMRKRASARRPLRSMCSTLLNGSPSRPHGVREGSVPGPMPSRRPVRGGGQVQAGAFKLMIGGAALGVLRSRLPLTVLTRPF